VTLDPVSAAALVGDTGPPESSAQVLKRVIAARSAAAERWSGHSFRVNASAPGTVLRFPPFRLPAAVTKELAQMVDRGTISARGYDRVLRIAWTIVDLDGRVVPAESDVDKAIKLRVGDAP
jgi:magnesium chelatase family protein